MKFANEPYDAVKILLTQLTRPATTTRRFSLPFSKEEMTEMLLLSLRRVVTSRGATFMMTDEIRLHAEKIAEWLIDPHGKQGLLLCGNYGNGKTSFTSAIKFIIDGCRIERENGLGHYTLELRKATNIVATCIADRPTWRSLSLKPLLAIDDLGTESTAVQDFGNSLLPITQLLDDRYDSRSFTIVTTNLTPAEISKTYGPRLADRFREMFRTVVFENPSYR